MNAASYRQTDWGGTWWFPVGLRLIWVFGAATIVGTPSPGGAEVSGTTDTQSANVDDHQTDSCSIRTWASSPATHVGICQRGRLIVRQDRGPWRLAQLKPARFLRDVAHGGGQFVAVGGSYVDSLGVILTSADGERWTLRWCGPRSIVHGVTHGGDLFVVVGDHGLILTSKNGAQWREQPRIFSGTLSSVAHGAGQFVAVGDDGFAMVSRNGLDWAQQATGSRSHLSRVRYTAGRFLAGGPRPVVQSEEGNAWTPVASSSASRSSSEIGPEISLPFGQLRSEREWEALQ